MMFHYTSQKGFEGIVKEDGIHLWFSDARYMNDSSELINAKKFLNQAADELFAEHKISESVHREVLGIQYNAKKFDGINFVPTEGSKVKFELHSTEYHKFVCCFSKESDSLPMWNYYLKNDGNGYAVGIDMNGIDVSECRVIGQTIVESDFQFDPEITPMLYPDAEKVSIFKSEILDFSLHMEAHAGDRAKQIQYIVALQQAFETYSTAFKDCHFEYEHEVRMMATVRSSSRVLIDGKRRDDIKYRLSHGLAIPYFELCIPNKKVLKAVSISPKIGLNSSDDAAIDSMRTYLCHLGYEHDIEIHCSEIPLRYY